jgi:DNA-binding Lrp family transcriptional regulator
MDDIDEQILYELMSDARNNSPPVIAEIVGVTPGTVRNRIEQLEAKGIIEGYHAHLNFERTERRLTTLFLCNVPFSERETIARAAYEIPGVINIRTMMGGRRSFHVLAVGEDTRDLRRIGTTLSELGVEIEDEMMVENELVRPYDLFSSDDGDRPQRLSTDSLDVPDRSEFAEVTVQEDARIAGMTISEAVDENIIAADPLIISISRGDTLITPHGDTVIESADEVTIFSSGGVDRDTLGAFAHSSNE